MEGVEIEEGTAGGRADGAGEARGVGCFCGRGQRIRCGRREGQVEGEGVVEELHCCDGAIGEASSLVVLVLGGAGGRMRAGR